MGQSIIIDTATAGAWKYGSKPSLQDGHCCRVSYIALNSGLPFETGTLIVFAPHWPIPEPQDRQRGGLTMATVAREGMSPDLVRDNSFWRRLAAAETIIGHALDFHIGALAKLVADCGTSAHCQWAKPRYRYDTMHKAAMELRIPDGSGAYKQPSLVEAHDMMKPESMDRLADRRAAALAAPRPVSAFGLVQVRAVELVWRRLNSHIGKPPPAEIDEWACA